MRSIARYRAWSLREPFVLHLTDTDRMTIRRPDPDRLLAVSAAASTAARLAILAGPDKAPILLEVLGPLDMQVARDLAEDLAEHFGCTDASRLVHLLDRYGPAIAADLQHEYQLNMLDVFRGDLLPDELMERIDNLPRHSRFAEALAQDDELAESMKDAPVAGGESVKFSEWTPETERLTIAVNLLNSILGALTSLVGGRHNDPPLPGPKGARERLEEHMEDLAYEGLLADVEVAKERWRADHPEEG